LIGDDRSTRRAPPARACSARRSAAVA
jgi:hypothetical protein